MTTDLVKTTSGLDEDSIRTGLIIAIEIIEHVKYKLLESPSASRSCYGVESFLINAQAHLNRQLNALLRGEGL